VDTVTLIGQSQTRIAKLKYIQSRHLSSCNNIKTFDFSTLSTTIHLSRLTDRLKELVKLCFMKKKKRMANVDINTIVLGRDNSYFVKINFTLILPKSSLKLISSNYSSFFLLTTYLLCLVDVFFNS
jgi:hypothetical protein